MDVLVRGAIHLRHRATELGPDPKLVGQANRELLTLGKVLDDHLSTREWVSGERLTLADVGIACPLMSTVPAKLPVTGFTHIQRWFTKIQALDAWKQTNPPG